MKYRDVNGFTVALSIEIQPVLVKLSKNLRTESPSIPAVGLYPYTFSSAINVNVYSISL